jgi:CheY-like chemotaxis protein
MTPIKILLVDDSKSARYALRLQLQRHEVVVETADSAEVALDQIKAEPPDAVFMDHTMPGMNGFEALEILKSDAKTAAIPVVMCTSNEDLEYREQALRKGAIDVLAKSAAKDRLSTLLDQVRETISGAAPAEAAAMPAAAPAAVDMASIEETIRRESARLLEERLDDILEERLQAALMPVLADFGDRLTSDTHAQIDRRLTERMEAESKRLRDQVAEVQNEQAKLSVDRLSTELLPRAVAEQFEEERTNLAQLVQELLDNSLDNIGDQPEFLRRVSDKVEASVLATAEQSARRHAKEVSEEIARDQAEVVASGATNAARPTTGTVYALSALSAIIGIGAAAAVYFLLS